MTLVETCRRGGAVLALAFLALPAAAQSPEGVAPEEVLSALRTHGAAEIETFLDEQGEPEISATIEGLSFGVIFYRCGTGPGLRCTQVQFRSSFVPEGTRLAALELMDTWNRTWVFGKAYLDEEGAFFIEHAFYGSGGVTRENVSENTALWLELLPDFARHIGFR